MKNNIYNYMYPHIKIIYLFLSIFCIQCHNYNTNNTFSAEENTALLDENSSNIVIDIEDIDEREKIEKEETEPLYDSSFLKYCDKKLIKNITKHLYENFKNDKKIFEMSFNLIEENNKYFIKFLEEKAKKIEPLINTDIIKIISSYVNREVFLKIDNIKEKNEDITTVSFNDYFKKNIDKSEKVIDIFRYTNVTILETLDLEIYHKNNRLIIAISYFINFVPCFFKIYRKSWYINNNYTKILNKDEYKKHIIKYYKKQYIKSKNKRCICYYGFWTEDNKKYFSNIFNFRVQNYQEKNNKDKNFFYLIPKNDVVSDIAENIVLHKKVKDYNFKSVIILILYFFHFFLRFFLDNYRSLSPYVIFIIIGLQIKFIVNRFNTLIDQKIFKRILDKIFNDIF